LILLMTARFLETLAVDLDDVPSEVLTDQALANRSSAMSR
jgi:hypothetical protein